MQFLLIADDGKDDGALERRMRVRDQHIAMGDAMIAAETSLFGVFLRHPCVPAPERVGPIALQPAPVRGLRRRDVPGRCASGMEAIGDVS